LNRSLTAWLQLMVAGSAPAQETLPRVHTLQELNMMIAEKPGRWAQQWLQEGMEKGRQEGRQEGIEQGQIELLLRQVQRRFGPIDELIIQRIRAAGTEDLETWSL